MKFHNVKRVFQRPFFVTFKKHHCPVCHNRLKKLKVSKVVNAKSEEAKNFDFSSPGGEYMLGDVKFIWVEFRCPQCDKTYTVDQLYTIEKAAKRTRGADI